MAAANSSLRVCRQLLDPKFDSYKLSLEPLPIYTLDLDSAVAEVKLREDQYTLDHMCVFGMYNYLHCDRWYQDSIYYIDQHERVMHLAITLIMFQQELGEPFVIVHSHSYLKAGAHSVDVVLLQTQTDESDVQGIGFHSAVDWLTITSANSESNKYEVSRHRTLHGKLAPHYAAVEQDGSSLIIASDKPFKFVQIDGNPVEKQKLEKMDTSQKKESIYYWQQTDEDLTVNIQLPDNTTKLNIDFQLSPGHLQVGLKGQAAFVEGQLYSSVDQGLSTWTVNENSLEIFLFKKNRGVTWPELIIGDRRGEFITDPDQASQINEGLLNLTSEELNTDPEKGKPPCNANELEECDRFPDDTASLTRFDANSLKATHVVNLSSHQYLFTAVVDPTEMPCLCLRHDVDALLWQPHTQQENMWEHIGTFNALGYVQASKRERKFSTCAPNCSYAALCECFRRVFIYRQPTPVQTVLYNRKEARHVGQIAKQQVASLETNDPVLGLQATNERLFVLTTKNLFIIKVNVDNAE
ncbi:nudC domain-containing protein 1 isoform X2 [Scyliorhinus canicula]|uniref:nudC domain-containing protein 1 isoform X2 n=1 Tax=Scyliorhinus canicula TaxID=7830 RepID=UPI0018F5748B|nr:nudC domain-containing protein 1 isoform X2 [Scyliorhinus canicula]